MESTATLTEAPLLSRHEEQGMRPALSPGRPADDVRAEVTSKSRRVRHTITTGALAVYTVVATLLGLALAVVAARLGTGETGGTAAGVVFFSVLGVFIAAAVPASDWVLQRVTKPQQR
ncbi:hypothetical protein [Kitasatospora sp. MAP5-34]|uniref:hypothetical protein n=1 Tax=Kitasatospora sp. MAP5-34 TaxID=3035102 RepID=UPI0024772726|nr:hypothetical protein [Kitasatospora sp. MAP5-34]MDH6578527.1 hypothetical protein [Kitasatospora sp. MAP5-34]